jgi:hypothetical protein
VSVTPEIPTLEYGSPPFAVKAPAGGPLSAEHLVQLANARSRGKKIRRTIGIARGYGWATAIFAGLTLLVSLFSFSVVGILLGAGMAVVAAGEFRGAATLKRLDPSGASQLGFSQLLLSALLLAYSAYSVWHYSHQPSLITSELASSPDVANMMGDMESLARNLVYLVYGVVAAVAIFVEGGMALYHFSRKKLVEAYVRDTPPWIIDAQRAGVPL